MNYKVQRMTFEEAKASVSQYRYALVYLLDRIILGETEPETISWEETMEARFFDREKELHVFRDEQGWKAVCVQEDPENRKEEMMLLKKYKTAGRYPGNFLVVKEYLGEDEDGQVFVELTRLCEIQ